MGYDTMLVGHFHTYLNMGRIIMNGSLIGYNEYANQGNFGFEKPRQALWLTHPKHGITYSMPVLLEDNAYTEDRGKNKWVSHPS